MLKNQTVYIGLGGNIGDTSSIFKETLACLAALPEISGIEVSAFYETSPVSDIPQPNYLNAVCRFNTNLTPCQLFHKLREIETKFGKKPKPKTYPRIIDLDILFFGSESFDENGLQIPHPRWRERLFVVAPLSELTKTIEVPCPNHGKQTIDLEKLKDSLKEGLCRKFV